ncbi:hypothetical protein DB88DRAFT_475292 [Papiliotrema laurentii]|uniref:Uncharacterized protein n=1 Tax=Papiliotrema laurentii TaxID=5418 RepID=A0AAD9FM34_PAPLA|nr:hypothetical protein DB88DRAFT_475292 [Papiliotrema laurentii]
MSVNSSPSDNSDTTLSQATTEEPVRAPSLTEMMSDATVLARRMVEQYMRCTEPGLFNHAFENFSVPRPQHVTPEGWALVLGSVVPGLTDGVRWAQRMYPNTTFGTLEFQLVTGEGSKRLKHCDHLRDLEEAGVAPFSEGSPLVPTHLHASFGYTVPGGPAGQKMHVLSNLKDSKSWAATIDTWFPEGSHPPLREIPETLASNVGGTTVQAPTR